MDEIRNGSEKIKILPMKEERKVLLKDVNNFFICRLCGGYLIDATGLIECFHTYCRSCIVQFLQKSTFCPVCEVQVNKTKPHLSLRPDAIIQRLIYKTVPGLYKSELLRRKQYLNDLETNDMVLSDDESGSREYYFSPEEPISISLEYLENDRMNKSQSIHKEDLGNFQKNDETEQKLEQISYKRYLRCPAALKINHIYKFIKLKYNLKKNHEVEISYDSTKLPGFFSLMDIAYTFSWKRDSPMRLCYQIFERIIIQVPLIIKNKSSENYISMENNFVTNSSSLSSVDTNKSEEEQSCKSVHSELDGITKNLKRKTDTNTKKWQSENTRNDKIELGEPAVKIPRISCNVGVKEEKKEEIKVLEATSLVSENSLKIQIKTPSVDSGLFSDDFMKYEQDIEEVDDDDDNDNDDDDNDRLRISQLSDQDEKNEDTSEQLVIDTSDFENKEKYKEEKQEDRKTRYKRKSKKSKHHHHHKHHHHRHHERKKAPPQATILHSPDTDIMKLKVKLNNVQPDTKFYHKQSRRKRKKSPESYFSSYSSTSSMSSVIASSPDTNSVSRTDDDSLHSHISEVSAESTEINLLKEEPNSTTKVDTPIKSTAEEPCEKYRSPTSKEKLLEMRSFRPKNIAVVKPEEKSKVNPEISTKNDSNNNDKVSVQVIEINDKPKPVSNMLRPTSSSSITVSKITAAEKMLMEQEKKMNGCNDDRPSLEITLVTEPSKTTVSQASSTTFTDISSANKGNKILHRTMKPVPPLVQLKSNEPTIPKSLTIFPQNVKNLQRPVKSSIDNAKKINDVLAMKGDGTKQSVTISLSGNHFENDSGVLDLSGKMPSKYPLNASRGPILLNKKSSIRPNGIATCYAPIKRVSPPADGTHLMSHLPVANMYSANIMNMRYSLAQSPKTHKISSSPSQSLLKNQVMGRPHTNKLNKTANIPPLAEIRIGPVSSSSDVPHKPRPNQNVRNIPNPSNLMHRHQPVSNGVPGMNTSSISMMNRLISTPCSFSNLKKNGEKCLQTLSEGYLDYSNVMATK